jgi:hypothetical protein
MKKYKLTLPLYGYESIEEIYFDYILELKEYLTNLYLYPNKAFFYHVPIEEYITFNYSLNMYLSSIINNKLEDVYYKVFEDGLKKNYFYLIFSII